jgi:hypothetical protein
VVKVGKLSKLLESTMKTLIVMITLLSASSAFALSDADLTSKCSGRALEKMQSDAALKNCEVKSETLDVYYVNNKFYNPSKYIGYDAEMKCSDGNASIFMIVEYDALTKECM